MNQKISILRNENEFLPRKKLFPKKNGQKGPFFPLLAVRWNYFRCFASFCFLFFDFPSRKTKGNLTKN